MSEFLSVSIDREVSIVKCCYISLRRSGEIPSALGIILTNSKQSNMLSSGAIKTKQRLQIEFSSRVLAQQAQNPEFNPSTIRNSLRPK